ncbi:hypothetical protein ACKXF6_12685, partial [Faecalibacterium taiwanense]|uniref:hypothetical protein n=1 Tax=Faecalibacterium taiwanense TaxID=3030638 RepID=UPI003AAF4643
EPQAGFPACTYAIAPSLLWITALYHKERIVVRISTYQRKEVFFYAVFDPHYFSPEPPQDPYQPFQLRTVTEWKPFSKPLPTGSKAS